MVKRINGDGVAVNPAPVIQATGIVKSMTIESIKKVEPAGAEKIVLFAPEGWGKSTWASKSKSPVFLSTEDGLKNIDAQAFPEPENWLQMFEAIESLRTGTHQFKTLVVDTADWTEHLCHKFILARDNKDSIESYGYGKGQVLAFEEWKKLLHPINMLRKEKGMNIIFLAHAQIKMFNNPSGDNFDRWELKTERRVGALLKEWADCVLFGSYDVAVDNKKGYGGKRVVYVNHTAAWDAKNRYGIDKNLSSDFNEFWGYVKGTAKVAVKENVKETVKGGTK